MNDDIPHVELAGPVDVRLPDGSVYRIRPGPYGKGVAVALLHRTGGVARAGQRGRRPRPSTLALRDRMERDHAKDGTLRPAPEYVRWLLARDRDVGLAVARQVVYRERRRLLDGA